MTADESELDRLTPAAVAHMYGIPPEFVKPDVMRNSYYARQEGEQQRELGTTKTEDRKRCPDCERGWVILNPDWPAGSSHVRGSGS